ncbi:MAG: phage tail protein [Thermosipho sp. (in: Bacteria)]|nr:phage tail protein [Thermosipho sp. (in: thermotogales)]
MIDKLLMNVYAESGQTYANSQRHDPLKNYKFLVEITGNMVFAKAGFQKVTGLKMSVNVIEYREGGDNDSKRKMPGLANYEPITLERGMSEDKDMWEFAMKTFDINKKGQLLDPDFRAVMIIKLLDRSGNVAKAWRVDRVWVSEYETGDFDAESDGVMIERIVLQHEGFTKIVG